MGLDRADYHHLGRQSGQDVKTRCVAQCGQRVGEVNAVGSDNRRKLGRDGQRPGQPSPLRCKRAGPIRIIVALAPIVPPVERLQVGEVVLPALCHGFDVIDLPPEAPGRSIGGFLNPGAATVLAIIPMVIARNDLSFFPGLSQEGAFRGVACGQFLSKRVQSLVS